MSEPCRRGWSERAAIATVLAILSLEGCGARNLPSSAGPQDAPRVDASSVGTWTSGEARQVAGPHQDVARAEAPAPAPAFDPALATLLDAATLPGLPEWTDRWFDQRTSEQRYFAIDVLMQGLGVPRALAVEVQNHHLDAMRADPSLDPRVAFTKAVERVRRGEFEDRRELDLLASARVIVVFDLDETLYDQSLEPNSIASFGGECTLLTVTPAEDAAVAGVRRIALAPGWEAAFDRIHELGGVVVLFTANLDDSTWANLRAWPWKNGTVLDHPALAGVLTNSHLVRRSRHETPSDEVDDAATGRRRPVWMEPSKDLRIVDETLSRVVLVDDNPHRIAQLDRARVPPKLNGDVVCARSEREGRGGLSPRVAQPSLSTIVGEIEVSLRWAEANGVSFAAAYLPHTMMGRVLVDELQVTRKWTRARAIEWVRRNPDRVARDF